jgi:hypothetical protein
MKLLLKRDTFTEKSTTGMLTLDGDFECFTLEDRDRNLEDGGEKIQNETAIPRGIYPVVLDFSPRFQRILPHVLNVPQFTGVRIHSGNRPEDTEGCILVGQSRSGDWVSHSQKAMEALFDKMQSIPSSEPITLEIV